MKKAIAPPMRPNGDGVGPTSVAAVAFPIAKVIDRADAGSPVAKALKPAAASVVPNIVDPPGEPAGSRPTSGGGLGTAEQKCTAPGCGGPCIGARGAAGDDETLGARHPLR